MATAAILSLICGVELDFTSLCGSGNGDVDLLGDTGVGVMERERVEGRLVLAKELPLLQPLMKRKLEGQRQYNRLRRLSGSLQTYSASLRDVSDRRL